SRSFAFAARLFPPRERERIARVYAYCRLTDDLVDAGVGDEAARGAALDAWLRASRLAYRGDATGLPRLDTVMGEMADCDVPFTWVEELVEGVRTDLRRERFLTLEALRVYTRQVAGVVGLWIAGLAGVRNRD